MYDHAATYREQRAAFHEAFERVLSRGVLDWGPEVPAFEDEFARWLGVEHAVATNSGTAALKVALLALGVGPGDEVVTVPNSDIATTSAIHHVGAKVVWVDVEPDTFAMDPGRLDAAIGPATKAILPVHLYGHPADMPALRAIADRHGIPIVEDACLALGSRVGDAPAGKWGTAACFSFAPTKHLGAFGSAGMVVTDDGALADRMRLLIAYGQPRERHYSATPLPLRHLADGLNERLDELHAALLRVKLPHLEGRTDRRKAHAARYAAALADLPLTLPSTRQGAVHTFRNYVVLSERRDALQRHLHAAGVATGTPYAPPLHLQPAFGRYRLERGAFPVAERAAARLLTLPVAPELTPDQIDYACERVAAFFAEDASSPSPSPTS